MKLKEIFRNKCIELLNKSEKRKLNIKTEGSMCKEDKFLTRLSGFEKCLHTLVDELFSYKPEIEENYTHKYVKKIFLDFIFDLKHNKEKNKTKIIDSYFEKIKQDLTKTYDYLVPAFIENLHLTFDLEIGKVKFCSYSKDKYEQIFYENGYKKNKLDMPLLSEVAEKNLMNVKCLGYCVVRAGEQEKAQEKANILIEEALSVIRFFDIYSSFGLKGDYRFPTLYTTNIYNKNQKILHSSMGYKDFNTPCLFTKERYEELKSKAGLNNIDLILKKEEMQRTDLENKLIISIRWFSEMIKHKEKSNDNLIRLFTALETLLIQNKNEEKKKNLAERLAFITYSEKENRLFVYALVSKMYSIRSELVHEGKTKFKEIDFNVLRSLFQQCIFNIAIRINKYPTLKDWLKIIDNAKFSEKLEYQ